MNIDDFVGKMAEAMLVGFMFLGATVFIVAIFTGIAILLGVR